MKKIFFALLLLTTQILFGMDHQRIMVNKSISHEIKYEWQLSNDLLPEANIYYVAFNRAYANFPLYKIGDACEVQISDFYVHSLNVMKKERLLLQEQKTIGGLTAYYDNIMVGFVIYDICNNMAKIRQIAVQPDYWGNGIGENLILKIFDRFADVDKIVLVAWKDNPKAIPFYKKIGFKCTNYQDSNYNQNEFIGLKLERTDCTV